MRNFIDCERWPAQLTVSGDITERLGLGCVLKGQLSTSQGARPEAAFPSWSLPVPASGFLPRAPALASHYNGLQPVSRINPFLPQLLLAVTFISAIDKQTRTEVLDTLESGPEGLTLPSKTPGGASLVQNMPLSE